MYIKSPLNYVGGKYKLLNELIPLFPKEINTFYDLFSGGGNVLINTNARKYVYNDIIPYVGNLISDIKNIRNTDSIVKTIEDEIDKRKLSKSNKDAFIKLRNDYNCGDMRWHIFYLLICHSFNNQFRFNSKHQYNSSFGDRSYNEKNKANLIDFANTLFKMDIVFTCNDFRAVNIDSLEADDFMYCDPPYLITTASYNDGKRGFSGWTEKEENDLLNMLDELNNKGIKFALSNVLTHKGKSNNILIEWCEKNKDKYIVHHLNHTYSNCNYHDKTGNKGISDEVLICNYSSK